MAGRAIRESDIEDYLARRIRAAGGQIRKLRWIGRRNAPDRIAMLRGVYFIELKKPREYPTEAQVREHKRMQTMGARVYVINTYEGVDDFMRRIENGTA